MPQSISMSENGQDDLEALDNLLSGLINYGLIHDEKLDEIDYILGLYFLKAYKLNESILDEFENEKDNYKDIQEYLLSNYGSGFFREQLDNLNDEEMIDFAAKYRDFISHYLCNTVIDPEKYLENYLS